MCKGFTALAIACLVADEKFIGMIVLIPSSLICVQVTTINSPFGTCYGTAQACAGQMRFTLGQIIGTKTQAAGAFAGLDASSSPRQDFIPNNFGYHAVGCVIE